MKRMFLAFTVFAFTTVGVYADEPPMFMKQTYPKSALKAAWEDYKAVYSSEGAIDAKHKQLIALGVSAQIPCDYCVLSHSKKARKMGATEEEIKEALAVASTVRKWSTMLNGYDKYTMEQFKANIGAPTKTK